MVKSRTSNGKRVNIMYWIFTGLLAFWMGGGGIPDIMSIPSAVELFEHLGYPAYLLPFLGVAKVLGSIVILIPGFPRLKEWAYAGLTIDLAGAMYSAIAVGDPVGGLVIYILGFALIAGSYICYHKRQKAAVTGSAFSA